MIGRRQVEPPFQPPPRASYNYGRARGMSQEFGHGQFPERGARFRESRPRDFDWDYPSQGQRRLQYDESEAARHEGPLYAFDGARIGHPEALRDYQRINTAPSAGRAGFRGSANFMVPRFRNVSLDNRNPSGSPNKNIRPEGKKRKREGENHPSRATESGKEQEREPDGDRHRDLDDHGDRDRDTRRWPLQDRMHGPLQDPDRPSRSDGGVRYNRRRPPPYHPRTGARNPDGTFKNLSLVNNSPNVATDPKENREKDDKNEGKVNNQKPQGATTKAKALSSLVTESEVKKYCLACHTLGHLQSADCKGDPNEHFLQQYFCGWKQYRQDEVCPPVRHETLIQAQDLHSINTEFLTEDIEMFVRERDTLLSMIASYLQKNLDAEGFAVWNHFMGTCCFAVHDLFKHFKRSVIGYHSKQVIEKINQLRPDGPDIPQKPNKTQIEEYEAYLYSIRNDIEKIRIQEGLQDEAAGWMKDPIKRYRQRSVSALRLLGQYHSTFRDTRKRTTVNSSFRCPLDLMPYMRKAEGFKVLRVDNLHLPSITKIHQDWQKMHNAQSRPEA